MASENAMFLNYFNEIEFASRALLITVLSLGIYPEYPIVDFKILTKFYIFSDFFMRVAKFIEFVLLLSQQKGIQTKINFISNYCSFYTDYDANGCH